MFEIIDALRAGSLESDYVRDGTVEKPPGIITTKVCAVSGTARSRTLPFA